MTGDGPRWALVNCKKELLKAQDELFRLRETVDRLRGMVLDLGGDPDG